MRTLRKINRGQVCVCVCAGVFVRVKRWRGVFLPTDTVAAAADDITQRAPGFYVCFFLSLSRSLPPPRFVPPVRRVCGAVFHKSLCPRIIYTAYADVRARKSIRRVLHANENVTARTTCPPRRL